MNDKTNAMILAFLMVVSVLCVSLCIADESDGAGSTYFVDGTDGDNNNLGTKNSPWKTIKYDTVKDGDTVIVTGNFDHISVNRFISIEGEGATTGGIIFNWSDTDGLLSDNEYGGSEISISGLEITGMINDTKGSEDTTDYSRFTVKYTKCNFTAETTHMSLCVYKGYNLVIENCNFSFENTNGQKQNSYAIFVMNLSGLTVNETTFDGFSRFINADTLSGTMIVSNCKFGDLVPIEEGEFEARAIQIAGDLSESSVNISGNTATNGTKTSDGQDQGIFLSVHDSSIGNPTVSVDNNYVKEYDALIQYASKDDGSIPKIKVEGVNNICLSSDGNVLEQPVKAESEVSTDDLANVNTFDLQIDSEAELRQFAEMVNSGNSFEGETVTLSANITLNGEWTPIGSEENPFMGTFDGQDKTITNITIDDPDMRCAGLFGYLSTPGMIENVNVNDVNIKARSYVGALLEL